MPDPIFEKVAVGWTHSANERFKQGWRFRVAAGTAISIVAHLVPIFAWPDWVRMQLRDDLSQTILELEWISVLPDALTLPGFDATAAELAPARTLGILPDSIPDNAGLGTSGEGIVLAGTSIAMTSDLFRERLLGGRSPVPTIVEQPSDPELPSGSGSGTTDTGDDVIPERDLTTADFPDFADLPGTSPMDLDRLSAVRPELVLSAPSNWVLIRNPIEVEQFVQRSYRSGDLTRGVNGSVSVALWIDESGSVEWAEINQSSGRPDLDRVALALFSEVAAFRPARDEGVPVPRSVIFWVRFPWY